MDRTPRSRDGFVRQVSKLRLDSNSELTSVDALSNVTQSPYSIEIIDNPKLPTCDANRLATTIGPATDSSLVTIESNDDDATCPP